MTIDELETERLVLRGFREEDLDPYAEISADEETMRYMGGGVPGSREDTWRGMAIVLGHWALRGFGLWAVEEKATGRFIGRIGIHNPEGWPGVEVGWMLARDRWGHGYATEGARASVRYAYDVAGIDDLITMIDPANHRSIRVADKLGATLRERIEFRGKLVNIYAVPRPNRGT
jgi:RimJ/RimL family protein N-acetyltransferase